MTNLFGQDDKPKTKPPRAKDEIWEAVGAVFNLTPNTKAARDRMNNLTKEFKSIGTTPDEIAARFARLKEKYTWDSYTGESLVKWWNEVEPKDEHAARTNIIVAKQQAEEDELLAKLEEAKQAAIVFFDNAHMSPETLRQHQQAFKDSHKGKLCKSPAIFMVWVQRREKP